MVVSPGGWTGRAECLSSELNITGAHSLSATLWVWGGLSFSLCPLSFFLSLSSLSLTNTDSGLWGIGFFFLSPKVHRPQKPRALTLQKDVDLDYYQNPLKFLLCVTSAESSTEKWRAQFVAYFNRQREHLKADGTDLASFFSFFFAFMVNRPMRMNLQWSSRAPCIRAGRLAHKRLDSDDQPPAKCARLSAEAGDTQGLLGTSPGSPVSPGLTSVPPTHQGPSSIGSYLLLPLADRECMHSAMNTDTGNELLCKVCAIQSLCNFFEWRMFQDIPLPNTLSDMSSVFGWLFHQMSFSREMCHDFRNKSLTSLYIFFYFIFLNVWTW